LVEAGDGEGDTVGAALESQGLWDGVGAAENGVGDPVGVVVGAELVVDPQATTRRATSIVAATRGV
jgi:hypothetical protein